MATSVKTAIDVISRRVRDPQNSATSRDTVRLLLQKSEQALNSRLALVTLEFDFQLHAEQQFYGDLDTLYPIALRVIGFHDNERDIPMVDWTKLHHFDGTWFRRLGPEAQVWSPVGRNAVLIHPGLKVPHVIHCMAAKRPPALTTEAMNLFIPDQYIPLLFSVVEAQLLAKSRELDDKFKIVYDMGIGRITQHGEERRVGPGKQPLEQPVGPTNE